MILYNVTVILDEEIQETWLNWMQQNHIPKVMATNCFISNRLLKVLDSPNEGITYCVQYIAENMDKYQEYKQKFAARLQAGFPEQFINKFVVFRTLMEFIA